MQTSMHQADNSAQFGIIGGSGLQSLSILLDGVDLQVDTPFGAPSAAVRRGLIGRRTAFFLPRHGPKQTIAPHCINYRANLWALRHFGVLRIVSVASVGGIQDAFSPGTLVVPDQLLDYTWGRPSTFGVDGDSVTHIDFTEPFSAGLRAELVRAGGRTGANVIDGAVYATTQGPRLETAAEIRRIERDGGNIVGMTGMPEAALAREIGLEYAMIAVVVNSAAGRGTSKHQIQLSEMADVARHAISKVESILEALISS